MMIIDLIKIIITTIKERFKNIRYSVRNEEDLKRYFMSEYKNNGKQAYEYWIHTNGLNYSG